MSLTDWYRYHVRGGSLRDMTYHLYLGLWRKIGRVFNYGTPIWSGEWDVMIILDACRYDLLEEVASEYDFLSTIENRYSLGSDTGEWMAKNFTPEAYEQNLGRTAYIAGNPRTEKYDMSTFGFVDEVWKHSWDDTLGSVRAEAVTDSAIQTAREQDPDQLLVHYVQPHLPLVPDEPDDIELSQSLTDGVTDWEEIRNDPTLNEARLRDGFLVNLRYVLESVERLLRNIDAETVVISADHGELFGEPQGAYLWGHPPNVPIPLLKRVPWAVTEAEGTEREETAIDRGEEDDDLDEKLAALGYK